ncbi:MAG TPA: FAD-binding oxidoreductase [Pseudonocardiaceae bacterium]
MISRRDLLRAGIGAAALGAPLWTMTAASQWDKLRSALAGTLVLPGDPTYDTARQLDNGVFDAIAPAAIAYCANVMDVQTCLRFAQDQNITTAVRSGGHSAAGYSTTTGLVLDVSRLNQITVGPTVTVGPGAQGVDVLAALTPVGMAAITGSCPTVCAGGYLQGGGIGPLSRKFGVGSDHLVSADVVLADGRFVRCSATCEPDLFWALRGGGGGNFGVVTRFELIPTTTTRMVTFSMVWPLAAEVIAAYQPWLAAASNDLTAELTVINQNAIISGGWLGDPTALTPQLDELAAAVGTAPLNRTVTDQSYHDAMMAQYGCATKTVDQCHRTGTNPAALLPRHSFVVDRGRLLDNPLHSTAIDQALAAFAANPTAGQFRVLSITGLGGQINEVPSTATAYPHRTAQYYLNFTAGLNSFTPTPDEQAAAQMWADGGFAVAAQYGDGEGMVNFIDPHLPDWRRAYYGDNYDRLAQLKHHYDPHNFFRFPQSIGS